MYKMINLIFLKLLQNSNEILKYIWFSASGLNKDSQFCQLRDV